jgi:hypothetical protein
MRHAASGLNHFVQAKRGTQNMDAIRNAFFMAALGVFGAEMALGAQVSAGVTGAAGELCFESNSTGTLLTVSCAVGGIAGSASGVADYRHVGVASSAAISVAGSSGLQTVGAGGGASVNDVLTITSPGRTGTADLTFSFMLQSTASTSANATLPPYEGVYRASEAYGSAEVDARLYVGGQIIRHAQAASESYVVRSDTDPERTIASTGLIGNDAVASALGTYQYTVPIILGQEFSLVMSMTSNIYNYAGGIARASASIEAMNSFDWGGIQSVTVDGQPVEFSVTSQSGTDWIQAYTPPVPELPTSALLLTGLGFAMRRALTARRANTIK